MACSRQVDLQIVRRPLSAGSAEALTHPLADPLIDNNRRSTDQERFTGHHNFFARESEARGREIAIHANVARAIRGIDHHCLDIWPPCGKTLPLVRADQRPPLPSGPKRLAQIRSNRPRHSWVIVPPKSRRISGRIARDTCPIPKHPLDRMPLHLLLPLGPVDGKLTIESNAETNT